MKKIIICLLVLLLTGCGVQCDLIITDDNMVKEKLTINVPDDRALLNFDSIDEFLNYYTKYYPKLDGFNDYTIKGKDKEGYVTLNVSSEKHLNDYIKTKTYNAMFSSATVDIVGDYTTFKSTPNLYIENQKSEYFLEDLVYYDNFTINIQFYNKVINHNADMVDEKNNVYTWIVTKENPKEFISFKTSGEKRYDVIIKDFINSNKYLLMIIGGIIFIAITSGIIFYTNYQKNREL